jgi:Gas vesicle protein G
MGILAKLLTFPITAPLDGTVWLARQIANQAEAELYDEGRIRAELLNLELRHDLGEISEEEFEAAEEALLDRLKAARQWRMEQTEEE